MIAGNSALDNSDSAAHRVTLDPGRAGQNFEQAALKYFLN